MKKVLIPLTIILGACCIAVLAVFATPNGQAEGKALNAEKQIVVDGDMEQSTANTWTGCGYQTRQKVSGAAVDGKRVYRVTINGGYYGCIYQTGIFEVGKTYKIEYYVRGDGAAVFARQSALAVHSSVVTTAEWQRVSVIYTAVDTSNPDRFGWMSTSGEGHWYEIDDAVVTEYHGELTNAEEQLLTDGDMEASGTTNWSALSATLSKEAVVSDDSTQALRITSLGAGIPGAYQTSFTIGKRYRVTGKVRTDSSRTVDISDRNSTGRCAQFTAGTEYVHFDCDFIALHSQIRLTLESTAADQWAEFDDVMATEYIEQVTNHDKQRLADGDMETPSDMGPNQLIDGDMENAGTSDWASVSGAVLSKGTTDPHGGAQVLHIVEDTGYGSARPVVSPVSAGTTYTVRGYARSDGTRTPIISQSTIGDVWIGSTDTDWQQFNVQMYSSTGLIYFGVTSSGAPGGYVEFDDITVQEGTDDGTGSWTGTSGTKSKEPGAAVDGSWVIRITDSDANSWASLAQTVTTVGKRYRVSGWYRTDGTATAQIYWVGNLPATTEWTYFEGTGTASYTYFAMYVMGVSGWAEFDDVMVTEL